MALPLRGIVSFASVRRESLLVLAARADIAPHRAADLIDETLNRLRGAWQEAQSEAPYPSHHRALLEHHWRSTVPLLWESGGV